MSTLGRRRRRCRGATREDTRYNRSESTLHSQDTVSWMHGGTPAPVQVRKTAVHTHQPSRRIRIKRRLQSCSQKRNASDDITKDAGGVCRTTSRRGVYSPGEPIVVISHLRSSRGHDRASLRSLSRVGGEPQGSRSVPTGRRAGRCTTRPVSDSCPRYG